MIYKYELIVLVPEHSDLNGIGSIVDKYAIDGQAFTPDELGYRLAYPIKKNGVLHEKCDRYTWTFNMAYLNARDLERELNELGAHLRYLLVTREEIK